MATSFLSRRLRVGAFAVSALVLSGCVALAPATPEEAVKKRATTYWTARQAGQIERLYAMSPPSYRQLRTLEQFRLQFGAAAAVKSAEVANVTCEPEKCVVKVKLTVTPALAGLKVGNIDTYFDEIWLLEDGQWWHHQSL